MDDVRFQFRTDQKSAAKQTPESICAHFILAMKIGRIEMVNGQTEGSKSKNYRTRNSTLLVRAGCPPRVVVVYVAVGRIAVVSGQTEGATSKNFRTTTLCAQYNAPRNNEQLRTTFLQLNKNETIITPPFHLSPIYGGKGLSFSQHCSLILIYCVLQ